MTACGRGVLVVVVSVVALLAAVASSSSSSSSSSKDGAVWNADALSFDALLRSSDYVLVKFYSSSCLHSRRIAAVYQEAAASAALADRVAFAQVNVHSPAENAALESRFRIEDYPALVLFHKGKEYARYRPSHALTSADTLVNWLLFALNPVAEHFADSVAFSQYESKYPQRTVVAVHRDLGTPEYELLKSELSTLASEYPDLLAITAIDSIIVPRFHPSIYEHGFGRGLGAVRFRGDDHAHIIASSTPGSIERALRLAKLPHFGQLSDEIAAIHALLKQPTLVALLGATASPDSVKADVQQVVERYPHYLSVYVRAADNATLVERLGLEMAAFSGSGVQFAIVDFARYEYFLWSAAQAEERDLQKAVQEFVVSHIEKQLTPVYRNRPAPKQFGPVREVIEETWTAEVLDSAHDVFVDMYTPWCQHCRKLLPLWEEFATKVAHVSTLRVSKMDCKENAPRSEYNVTSYPTLLFFPAGKKSQPIVYKGARTVDALVAFARAHATHSFTA